VSAADCRSLAERALKAESAVEVRALASEMLNRSVEGETQ
jgi:hypothetical protein